METRSTRKPRKSSSKPRWIGSNTGTCEHV
jgi:hypothetical protein